MSRRLLILIVVVALAATACSSSKAAPSAAPKPAPTTAPPTTTTMPAPPPTARTLHGVVPADLLEQAEAFYAWIADRSEPQPRGITPELAGHVAGVEIVPGLVYARAATKELQNGDRVAVLTGRNDELFYVDTGGGWRIVGANLEGLDPWLGSESPRTLLVLGSDARVGENQLGQRADSVHVLTMVPATGQGAFVGFPRDSWVRGSKLTNLLPRGGPDLMVEVIEEITSLEMDGWVAVGFEGFLGLIEELGSLQIDLPRAMRSGNSWDDYPAGKQVLTPQLALRLARIRKGLPAGDFDRSFNQGLVMLAALVMVQNRGILELPRWVAAFDRHGFTDLDTGELLTWLATAYVTDMEKISNVVVPGTNATAGAAAIVRISPSAEDLFRDLDDGVLDG